MGNHLASQSSQVDHTHLHDLPGILYESSLGQGWFLKTLRCIHDEGTCVVKVFVKKDQNLKLDEYEERLKVIKDNFALIGAPNVVPFQKWENGDSTAYLIRQYFINNLYDRLSTRPFLTMIEKKWIAYQLLNGLSQAHFYEICHGDIKTENIMVTSWNWIHIADFASYKPVYLSEDNPGADFSYFFDTSKRRTCYIAPERFSSGAPTGFQQKLTPTMDLFSAGCVIAELFLDGTPLFDFAQMLAYKKGEQNEPTTLINKINDPAIQELIKHMIQRDPEKRLKSAKDYLEAWKTKVFPDYFEALHKYVFTLMKSDSEEKVSLLQRDFFPLFLQFAESAANTAASVPPSSYPHASLLDQLRSIVHGSSFDKRGSLNVDDDDDEELSEPKNTKGVHDQLGEDFIQEAKKEDQVLASMLEIENLKNKLEIQYSTPSSGKSLQESSGNSSKQKIPKKNTKDGPVPTPSPIINSNTYSLSAPIKNTKQLLMKSTSHATLPVAVSTNGNTTISTIPNGSEGLVILLNILCSFVHTVKLPSTKLTALELFSLFGKYLDSEIRLQRIVPHVVHMLSEDRSLVRATAIRVLTGVLEQVFSFPPSDSHIFPAYLLPALQKFCSQDLEHDQLVREAFAENIARLADVARKFLEASQYFKQTVNEAANGSNSNGNPTNATTSANSGVVQESYESELSEIQDAFYDMVVEMLTKDTSTHVKVTLISDITRLCMFFGRQKTNDFLLPLIITFLNDRHHWELRCAFLNNIVGVSSFVGMDSLEHFILPCLLQALTDEEEFVIDKTVNSLASLCDLKLFRKHKLFDIAEKTAAMLYHPNVWIRYGVIAVMTAIASQLNLADIHCFLIPVLKPFLITDIIHINDANLLDALNPPVSRTSFDKAMLGLFNIISKVDNGIPLQSAPSSSSSTVRDSMLINLAIPSIDGKEVEALDPVDLAFLRYLSDQGIPKEEEEKLFAMKSFIKGACRGLSKKFKTNTEDESLSPSNPGNTKENSGNSPYVVPSGGLILHSIALPNPNGGASRNRQSAQPTPIGKGKAPIKLTSTSNFGSVTASSLALGLSATPAPNNNNNTSTITIKTQKTGDSPSSGSSGSGGKNEEWKHLFNGSNHSSPSLSNKNSSVAMGTSVSTPMNSRVHLDKNTFSPSSTSPANITLLNANTSSSLIPTSSASGSFVVTDTTSKMKAVHIIPDYNPSSPSVAPAKSTNAKSVNQNSSSSGTGATITISSASLPLSKLFPPAMPDLGSLSFENSSGNFSNNSGSVLSPSERNISSPNAPNGTNNSGVSVSSPSASTSTGNLGTESLKEWQPKGILVAHLHEHKGAISNIQVTADNMFFVTGSDDGTVKIWDCRRLEKNVTNRSRLTYSSQGGKIKALTICESSHSVASGSDNGTIHVFKIEYATKKDTSLNRYTGVSTIKNLDPSDGAIMEIDHFNTDSQSIILYATNRGKVHAWDLRAKKEPFSLHNPPFFGLLETFVIEPNRNWIVTGTSSGYFTVWDLRFLIPVKFWRHPAKSRIHKLAHYHVVKNSSWFFCTSGVSNDVSVWDVQTASCKQYFRVLQSDASTPLPSFKVTASSDFGSGMPIATTSSSTLASAVTGGMGLSNFSSIDSTIEELQKQKPTVTNVNNSIQSSIIRNSSGSGSSSGSSSDFSNIHLNSNGQAPISVGIKAILNPADCSYLLTAGDDRRIRYWNLQNAMNSYTISGLANDQPRPRYSSHVYDGLTVYQELPNNSDPVNLLSNSLTSSSSSQSTSSIIPSNSGGVSSISKLRGPSSAPINHHESVLDMKVMDYPHRMLLSAGRDGVVKVWR